VETDGAKGRLVRVGLEGGIRSCEIGPVMLRRFDAAGDGELRAAHKLVRFAIPRRTYTQSHMDNLVEVILEVWQGRATLCFVLASSDPILARLSFRTLRARWLAKRFTTKWAIAIQGRARVAVESM
jgi:tryptophanase